MSTRISLLVASLSLSLASCGKGDKPAAGSGSAAGSGPAATVAIDAAPPPPPPPAIDASLADGTLQYVGIDVLTPPKDFESRAAGAKAPMEPLVVAARLSVQSVDDARKGQLGDTVAVWIAVRPGNKVRSWVALPGKTGADDARREITTIIDATAAPTVTGPVAFMVVFDRSGARSKGMGIPIPPELEAKRAANGANSPDELIERAWQ